MSVLARERRPLRGASTGLFGHGAGPWGRKAWLSRSFRPSLSAERLLAEATSNLDRSNSATGANLHGLQHTFGTLQFQLKDRRHPPLGNVQLRLWIVRVESCGASCSKLPHRVCHLLRATACWERTATSGKRIRALPLPGSSARLTPRRGAQCGISILILRTKLYDRWHWVALDRHPVAPMQEV